MRWLWLQGSAGTTAVGRAGNCRRRGGGWLSDGQAAVRAALATAARSTMVSFMVSRTCTRAPMQVLYVLDVEGGRPMCFFAFAMEMVAGSYVSGRSTPPRNHTPL